MRKSKSGSTQFNCFSPPVMIATMAIEVLLALYTVWRYKMTNIVRLIVVTLVTLASFQLAEYMVCAGHGLNGEQWSRLGFVMITLLPPLGIHIVHELAGKPGRRLIAAAYATMAGYILFFLLYHPAFTGNQCTGNYVIFQLAQQVGGAYTIYYFGWLLAGITLAAKWSSELIEQGKKAYRQVQALRAMIIGYMVFLVPTAIVNVTNPTTRRGIPSIMCGFAVLLALILACYILPRAGKVRLSRRLF